MVDNKTSAKPVEESLDIKSKKSVFKRFKKLFLMLAFLLTIIISVAASVSTTLFLIKGSSTTQTKELESQEKIATLEARITQQDAILQQVAGNTAELKTYLRHSSANSLKNIMLNQEKNIQSFLVVLKASMRDLSVIVGRADDWQRDYDNQLNIAIQQSQKREQLLVLLKTGEPTK